MAQHISGKNWSFFLDAIMVNVENITLSIEDGRTVKMSKGVPNGYYDGPVSAKGDIELDPENFALLSAYAASKGSWKNLDDIDLRGVAVAPQSGMSIEAFGCLFKLGEILNADPNGSEGSKVKLSFEVAGRDFVHLNGVPYIDAMETVGIL